FFASRRRHTRCYRDWSSDVCSSDLLADRLQTPIFVMLDLDIGMNHRLCRPLSWDDNRKYDRGKVMTAADLEAGKDFGRYLDVDRSEERRVGKEGSDRCVGDGCMEDI